MFEPHVSPSSHVLSSKGGYQVCVSSLRFGSGLYEEAGILGGSRMWVCGSGPWRCTLLVVPIYVCGVFLWRRSCVSSPVGGWVGSYWASFGVAALPFFLGHLRFSAACHAASCPSRVPHLADSGWLPYSCGGRLARSWGCLGTVVLIPHLVSTLCRRNSPFCFFPFGVLHPWRVRQHVCIQSAGLLLRLGWWGLCYVTWFSPMSQALPQGLRLAQPSQLLATLGFFFRSPGVCPSASLVAWVRLPPFPSFSGLLLLRLLAGVVGVLHPVSGCSSCRGVCLVCRCGHPAALPLP